MSPWHVYVMQPLFLQPQGRRDDLGRVQKHKRSEGTTRAQTRPFGGVSLVVDEEDVPVVERLPRAVGVALLIHLYTMHRGTPAVGGGEKRGKCYRSLGEEVCVRGTPYSYFRGGAGQDPLATLLAHMLGSYLMI